MGDEADRAAEEEFGWEFVEDPMPDYDGGERCPYCDGPVHQTNASLVYGHQGERFGKLWVCAFYPKCDAYVGSHPDGRPKGSLANPSLRMARRLAHDAFDASWRGKGGKGKRSRAYEKLAKQLKLSPRECHIGLFNEEQCQRVVALYAPKAPTGPMTL